MKIYVKMCISLFSILFFGSVAHSDINNTMRYEKFIKNEKLQGALVRGFSYEPAMCISRGIPGELESPDGGGVATGWFVDISQDWVGVRRGKGYSNNNYWIKCTQTHWIEKTYDKVIKLKHSEMWYVMDDE